MKEDPYDTLVIVAHRNKGCGEYSVPKIMNEAQLLDYCSIYCPLYVEMEVMPREFAELFIKEYRDKQLQVGKDKKMK